MGENESDEGRLARIETKLDQIILRDADHERRLRFMERVMIVAIIAAGAGGAWMRDVIPVIGS